MNSNSRGTIFNYGFSLLVLLMQPALLVAIRHIVFDYQSNWFIGIVCFAAIVADTYAIIKLPRYRAEAVVGVFLWLAHMALTSITLMIALSAFDPGITHYTETTQPGTLSILVFLFFLTANTLKEIAVLMMIIQDPEHPKPQPVESAKSKSMWSGEIALLFAASVQYVTFLGLVASNGTGNTLSHGPVVVVELIASFVLFAFGFFPLRLPYTVKEIVTLETSPNIGYIMSVLFAYGTVMYPIILQSYF